MHPHDVLRFTRPTWTCVHFDSGGVHPTEIDWPPRTVVRQMSGRDVSSDDGLRRALSEALAFPRVSSNWDSVNERLRDLFWLPHFDAVVLVIDGARELWTRAPHAAGKLVQSWLFCAQYWARQQPVGPPSDRGLHLVFRLDGP